MKILKYTEFLYLAVAIISLYQIYALWSAGEEFYTFVFFAVVSIGMFAFRRHYRKKFEKRKQDNNS
tara:strand:- start:2558 stop:2755 length:198 start_codon:yes stop_codon:yes gene_type:complete